MPFEGSRPLEQEMYEADNQIRDRGLRLREKAMSRMLRSNDPLGVKASAKYDKVWGEASRIELDHFQRTGRWMFGVPPSVPDWYPDPSGRFHYRYYDGGAWTEHVSTGGIQAIDAAE